VPPGFLEVFELPRREVDGSTGAAPNDGTHTAVTSNAYRIGASHPVTAYQFNPLENVNVFSNDASLLLPTSYRYFGECLFMLGDLAGARREYEAFRDADPDEPESNASIGLVDLEEARLDDAESRFRHALDLYDAMREANPRLHAARAASRARCHARLADVHLARDEYEAARDELIASTTIEPRNISAFFTLNLVYRRLGQTALAEDALARYDTARRAIIDAQDEENR
jgi:tetratricopeptide (TPR) repeat protein